MILPEELLVKVDAFAGGKNRRSTFIEAAIRAYIIIEEKKAAKNGTTIGPAKKTGAVK
jgi:metal-responsive CopG/Arc/MetJ family transcriptional regulator